MWLTTPRLVVAGLAGDSGKTLVALGLVRAFRSRGVRVVPFKKGPDYIDAAWLSHAAGAPGRNLDTFLMAPAQLGPSLARAASADLALIEGNRGLYDGLDADGSHSTAELAKWCKAPVLLVVDVTKMTRTTAALVQGCVRLDPEVHVAAVVLNRVGTPRQEELIREAIRRCSGPPVLGAVPRVDNEILPGRHLGLVTAAEHPRRETVLDAAARLIDGHVDVAAVLEAARSAPGVSLKDRPVTRPAASVRIGVFRDEALSFYYPENLEALEEAGATLTFISALRDRRLPEVDGLYFGGGFPEVHVDRLAGNRAMLEAVRGAAAGGMPVYAECGGLMFLARELRVAGVSYPMSGVLDLVVEQTSTPKGHGYVEASVDRPNPFFPPGARLRGHEFHYSHVVAGRDSGSTVMRLDRGRGLGRRRDGLVKGRVWASYLHLHASGTPAWATSFVNLAAARSGERDRAPSVERPVRDPENDESEHESEKGGPGVAAAGA
jgi:cobyrinic acid a,c-diamide synthase